MSKLAYLITGPCLVLAVGCSSDPDPDSSPRGPSAAVSLATSAPASEAPSAPASKAPEGSVAERCGPPHAPAHWTTLPAPGKNMLSALVVGDGPVTAVYSHQTGTTGGCGFWPFAEWLAETHGIRSVLLDHCAVGKSTCPDPDFAADRVAQLQVAINWANAHGARRLSLVGASLGGTTVTVAAADAKVDAVVNLSGPVFWPELDAIKAAPRVTEPMLLALARDDDIATPGEYGRLRSALGSRVTKYLTPKSGHGWELLDTSYGAPFEPTPVADAVADWLCGRYGD